MTTTARVWSTISTGPARELINEWERLRYRSFTLRHVNAWPFIPVHISDLDDVLGLAGFGKAPDDAMGDNLLWHLAKQAATDDIAARIVLHRILPPLMAMAKRRGQVTKGGTDAAMVDILSTAWCVIREYPYERRRHKVAANLVRDIEYHAFVRHHRLRHVHESHVGDDVMQMFVEDATPTRHMDYLSMVNDAIAMGLDRQHIRILQAFADGRCNDEVAREFGVSSRTVRNHKRSAVEAIRDAYAEVNQC